MSKLKPLECVDRLHFILMQLKGFHYLLAHQREDDITPNDIDEIREGIAMIFRNIIRQIEGLKNEIERTR